MDLTAICIRLPMMQVLILLVAHTQQSSFAQEYGAACPHILPKRLQFFEYESISLNCEHDGSSAREVMRNVQEAVPANSSNWVKSGGSGIIKPAFRSDSGRYWCENEEGLRSSAVNISVTAGSVILESPVLPVMEGDSVTLHCTRKKSSSELIADFYKYGLFIRTGYKGSMTIHKVSKSDEGLYSCYLSGIGESPQSFLAVRKHVFEEENQPTQSHSSHLSRLWIICVFLVALLPLMVGLHHCSTDIAEDNFNTEVTYSTTTIDKSQGNSKALSPLAH